MELRQRLIELRPELNENKTKNRVINEDDAVTLSEWVKVINRKKQRKAHLVALCTDHMGLKLSGHENICHLEKMAMTLAMENTETHGEDYVGFGRHASDTYAEVTTDSSYCTWILRTFAEELGGHAAEATGQVVEEEPAQVLPGSRQGAPGQGDQSWLPQGGPRQEQCQQVAGDQPERPPPGLGPDREEALRGHLGHEGGAPSQGSPQGRREHDGLGVRMRDGRFLPEGHSLAIEEPEGDSHEGKPLRTVV